MRNPDSDVVEDVIEIVVMPLGSEKSTITLPKDSTVLDALRATGHEGSTARVGGAVATPEHILDDGDRIVVTGVSGGKIEGGN